MCRLRSPWFDVLIRMLSVLCCVAMHLQSLIIGVTTEDPETTRVPQEWGDIRRGQHWYVRSLKTRCRANHKGQERELHWVLDRSAGNTIGCCVLETGELHLYHNGRDVGVAWKGVPTGQPLWGFVEMRSWKMKVDYIIPKSEAMMCVVSLCSSRAMCLVCSKDCVCDCIIPIKLHLCTFEKA